MKRVITLILILSAVFLTSCENPTEQYSPSTKIQGSWEDSYEEVIYNHYIPGVTPSTVTYTVILTFSDNNFSMVKIQHSHGTWSQGNWNYSGTFNIDEENITLLDDNNHSEKLNYVLNENELRLTRAPIVGPGGRAGRRSATDFWKNFVFKRK